MTDSGGSIARLTRLNTHQDLLDELDRWRIRAARGTGKVKLSLQDIARASGVARSTLATYLSGATLIPVDALDAVVLALGASPAEARQWTMAWERATQAPASPSVSRVRQLPPDVAGFTGRRTFVKELDRLLDGDQGAAVVISAIAGTAGVGKTALAVHWAHRVSDRFPDGQLYVNLRGYDPGEPMGADAALALFLRTLGIEQVPTDPDQLVTLYRGALADRRMLILLDNARSAEQVRPLLPGTAGCLVVVTSRETLAGLVARDGAHRLILDRLGDGEAADLFTRLLGPERMHREAGAAAELARLCAGLPLAMRVAAERIARHPDATLASLVTELGDRTGRLDLLDADGDQLADVRAVFSWSYQALPEAVARTFRLLGILPGADIDHHAAAALAGVTLREARRHLDALARAHLVEAAGEGRWGMHDLLAAYAGERATAEESPADRDAALTRLLDHYLHLASTAMDLIAPHEHDRRPHVPTPASPAVELTRPAQARGWLDAERGNLFAAARHDAQTGRSGFVVQLSAILGRYLDTGGYFADAIALHRRAHEVAVARRDRAGAATALHSLAGAYWRVGRNRDALACCERALAIYRELGGQVSQGRMLDNIGTVRERLGDLEQAVVDHQEALALHRAIGDRVGEANALGSLGGAYWRLNRDHDSLGCAEQALALYRELGDRVGEGRMLANLGELDLRLGNPRQAVRHGEAALRLARDIGSRHGQAQAHDGLGRAHRVLAEVDKARDHWSQAIAIFAEIGAPEASTVRANLNALNAR